MAKSTSSNGRKLSPRPHDVAPTSASVSLQFGNCNLSSPHPAGLSMPTHIAISAMSVPATQQTPLLSLKVVRVNPLKLVLANRRDAYVVIDH